MNLIENAPYPVLKEENSEAPEFLNAIVLNCTSHGCRWHGAGNKENNVICGALEDLQWFCTYTFPIEGNLPDPVKMTVLQIETLPLDGGERCACTFKVRVLFTSSYSEREILNTIRNHVFCQFIVE